MAKVISLILLAEIWNTAGQILFKKSTNILASPDLKSFDSYLGFLKKIFLLPAIWLGLAAMAAGLIFWLMALAQADLSIVFPVGSLQYLLTLMGASLFLGEKMDRMKLSGTLLVVAGITLITISR